MISSVSNSFQIVSPNDFLPVTFVSEEASLIQKVKQTGDLQEFNELVLRYQDQVYRHAYWRLGDEQTAEDAAQEAFIRAYMKISSFRGDSFRAWILKITTNYCYDNLRWQKRHASIDLNQSGNTDKENEDCSWLCDPQPTPERLLERTELKETIYHCLLNLSPMYRLPIILVDLHELSYTDAAGIMGMPLGSFKSRLSRARFYLVQALKATPGYESIF